LPGINFVAVNPGPVRTEPWAGGVGAARKNCNIYISHFLQHWSYQKDAFDSVLVAFADNFMQPGNLAGRFARYRAAHADRIAMMKDETPYRPSRYVRALG